MKTLRQSGYIANISARNPNFDMLAFTIPSLISSSDAVSTKISNTISEGCSWLTPWKDGISPYRETCSINFQGESIARVSHLPYKSMNTNPFRVEFNPSALNADGFDFLHSTLRDILGSYYNLIWKEARITRIDANIDLENVTPDQIVVHCEKIQPYAINLDCNFCINTLKIGNPKKSQHLAIYNKSDCGIYVTRIEFRLRVNELPCFRSSPVRGIENIDKVMDYNPFKNLNIFSTDFMTDNRFDPGFYDCIRIRGLLGALAKYEERDRRIKEIYYKILQSDYHLDVFDPINTWYYFINGFSILSGFRN